MNPVSVDMVVDLQFGSTGKGLICGYIAEKKQIDTVIAAWGPNAGHTYIDSKKRRAVVTMLPISAHTQHCKRVLLGPGSILDLDALLAEVSRAHTAFGSRFRLVVHPQACVREYRHMERERSFVRIGSTMKGTGAAAIEKMERDASRSPLARETLDWDIWDAIAHSVEALEVDEGAYFEQMAQAQRIMVEGAQGYSLGIHRSFWPYTTSREVTPSQVASDCALPFAMLRRTRVIGTLRTYPIRVANRYDEKGQQIGTSGPCYDDQREISWADIGQQTELTTVTKLPRRVFTFSRQQLRDAMRDCSPAVLFLNFCNYMPDGALRELEDTIRQEGGIIAWRGFGPSYDDIRERVTL